MSITAQPNNLMRFLRNNFLGLMLLLGGFLGACKTPIKVSKPINPPAALAKQSAEFLVAKIRANTLNYEWFVAKSRTKFEDKDNNVSFTVQIRHRKDSLLWMTIKKVSVEGARVRMTPTTIEILDRQNDEYTQKPFEFIHERSKIPLTFAELQQLVVGNALFLDEKNSRARTDSIWYRLDGRKNGLDFTFWVDSSDYTIQKVQVLQGNRELIAELSDYQTVEGSGESRIPHLIDLNFSSPESGKVRIRTEYQNISLQAPENTNFEVPEHYKKL